MYCNEHGKVPPKCPACLTNSVLPMDDIEKEAESYVHHILNGESAPGCDGNAWDRLRYICQQLDKARRKLRESEEENESLRQMLDAAKGRLRDLEGSGPAEESAPDPSAEHWALSYSPEAIGARIDELHIAISENTKRIDKIERDLVFDRDQIEAKRAALRALKSAILRVAHTCGGPGLAEGLAESIGKEIDG